MLDTIKLGIPLTRSQHRKITAIAEQTDAWQWVLLNPCSGELYFRRVKGMADTDGESYHRQLRWDVSHDYIEGECRLTLEFSVPKYWYGHNIHLLYDFTTPLNHLRDSLNKQFGLKGRGQLIDTVDWHVLRADICYTWRFPSQKLAQRYIDSLKRFHFPRKKPIIYDDSIVFVGKTYSVKFYLKLPEFKAHDRKEMLKGNASLDWINHLETLADGVLRFEATLRNQYLKRHDIRTAGDLARISHPVEWLEGTPPATENAKLFAATVAASVHLHSDLVSVESTDLVNDFKTVMDIVESHPDREPPKLKVWGMDFNSLGESSDNTKTWMGVDAIEEGVISFGKRDNPTAILQFLLVKFIGENAGMQQADQVKTKLMEVYKPVKAARLVSFWLYIQRFGSAEAKEIFGHNSYYVSKRELKQAGVSLIEPPSGNNVTVIDRDFMRDFRLEVPSQFTTNKVDDFRSSGNLLNLVPRLSGEDAS